MILSQGVALLAFAFFFISFHAKGRKVILLLQLASLFCWVAHFILLSAWTGALVSLINLLATILFIFFKENRLLGKFIFFLSLVAVSVVTALTWAQYSQFALAGVSFMLIAKWQKEPMRIRQVALIASVSWIAYDYCIGSWGGVIAETLFIFSILASLRKKAVIESV